MKNCRSLFPFSCAYILCETDCLGKTIMIEKIRRTSHAATSRTSPFLFERLKLPGISWHRYPLATSQMIREALMGKKDRKNMKNCEKLQEMIQLIVTCSPLLDPHVCLRFIARPKVMASTIPSLLQASTWHNTWPGSFWQDGSRMNRPWIETYIETVGGESKNWHAFLARFLYIQKTLGWDRFSVWDAKSCRAACGIMRGMLWAKDYWRSNDLSKFS